jgi:hypothetical protein
MPFAGARPHVISNFVSTLVGVVSLNVKGQPRYGANVLDALSGIGNDRRFRFSYLKTWTEDAH